MSRKGDFSDICTLGGLTEEDVGTGWPGLASYDSPLDGTTRQVAVHAAPVAPHRTVSPDEVKIEPPGRFRPVQAPAGHIVVVVGQTSSVVDGDPRRILVAFPGDSRVGRDERWNATFFRPFIDEAARNGWATYERALAGGGTEVFHAFTPGLLLNYLDMLAIDVDTLPAEVVNAAVSGSGILEDPADDLARDRVAQTVTRVLRDRRFGRWQRAAYDGACAMCGMTLNLNQGAHAYPVETGLGSDHVSNGFYACLLHHKAFDDHRIYIDPDTLDIRLHPDLIAAATGNPANQNFINSTRPRLAVPADLGDRLNPDWLKKRYDYFEGQYDWALR